MKLIAIIPARAGSKGVPNKNKLVVAGKPLIGHILTAAQEVEGIERILVSTEDSELADIGRKYGAEIVFTRPPELAQDNVSIIDVLVHAVSELTERGFDFDGILSLQPTAPLLSSQNIQKAVSVWRDTGCDSVFTLREVEHNHPYRVQNVQDDGKVNPLFPEGQSYLQRQDLPKFYCNTGGLYLRRRELLQSWSGTDFCLGNDQRGVVVSQQEALNIDTVLDLEIFRAIAERGLVLR